jgi:hypothetical protein
MSNLPVARINPPITVVMLLGILQTTVLMELANPLSSWDMMPIRYESPSGPDMFIRAARMM